MTPLDKQKFEELAKQNQWRSASLLLKEFFTQKLSQEEQADLFLDWLDIYLSVDNRLKENYLQVLKSALSELKAIERDQNILDDALATNQVREKIKKQGQPFWVKD